MSRFALYLLAALVLAADQATKHWAMQVHQDWPDGSRPIIPGFFSLTYANNTGGAFSVFENVHDGTVVLAAVSAAAACAIIAVSLRARRLPPLLGAALGLALGGAVGNMADRVRLHYVVDFLDLHLGVHQWPIFNVADSAICVGVALLAVYFGRAPANSPRVAPAEK